MHDPRAPGAPLTHWLVFDGPRFLEVPDDVEAFAFAIPLGDEPMAPPPPREMQKRSRINGQFEKKAVSPSRRNSKS